MLPLRGVDTKGAAQNGLAAGVELREMEATAEGMPATVGGAGICLYAITKGLMRGVSSPLAAIGVFGKPMPDNLMALMGV